MVDTSNQPQDEISPEALEAYIPEEESNDEN